MFNHEKGKFYLTSDEGKTIAFITYKYISDYIAVDHTFVDPILRGQGIAQKLVDEVVKLARLENKKIDPICPYVHKLFEKDPQYEDIYRKK
ncbi:GNAT family N-acetyltransferase [Acholeplasma granularum]|uniref:GNAT family N-acetyltransferase n=1 Tax=Acholeplasma granularum TaxID=264635 RepID=UPI0004727327|nr:GNAT family N-acetyltransferase [Acholeplasma granularum]